MSQSKKHSEGPEPGEAEAFSVSKLVRLGPSRALSLDELAATAGIPSTVLLRALAHWAIDTAGAHVEGLPSSLQAEIAAAGEESTRRKWASQRKAAAAPKTRKKRG